METIYKDIKVRQELRHVWASSALDTTINEFADVFSVDELAALRIISETQKSIAQTYKDEVREATKDQVYIWVPSQVWTYHE